MTAHNIGNGFADENFANRSDCAITPPIAAFSLHPSALSVIVIMARILDVTPWFSYRSYDLNATTPNLNFIEAEASKPHVAGSGQRDMKST